MFQDLGTVPFHTRFKQIKRKEKIVRFLELYKREASTVTVGGITHFIRVECFM